jgi:hypothetical protein
MLLLVGLVLGPAAVADLPVASDAGEVQSLDFSAGKLIIGGLRYHMEVGAKVEIGGSYGAFTMLEPGMRVRFDYLVVSPSERRIVLIQELPANVRIDET